MEGRVNGSDANACSSAERVDITVMMLDRPLTLSLSVFESLQVIGRSSRPARQSRSDSVCVCECSRVPLLTAAGGSRWKDSRAAAGAESRPGEDDVGGGGVRTHGDPAAVQ